MQPFLIETAFTRKPNCAELFLLSIIIALAFMPRGIQFSSFRSFVLPSVAWNLRQSFALKFLKWFISQQLLIRMHSYLDHSYHGGLAFTPYPGVGLEVKI